MTHDTPPKRITREEAQAAVDPMLIAKILRDFGTNFDGIYPVDVLARGVGPEQSMIGLAIKRGHLITASEVEAMVAAALREAAAHGDAWIAAFGDVEIKYTPANAYAADAVLDYQDAILALIPQPASAALDKLIAEAEARGMERAAKILDKRIESLVADHGSHEWDTNVTNLPEWVETATEELEAQAASIRAAKDTP